MKNKFIQWLKSKPSILYIVAFWYSLFHRSNIWRYLFTKNVTFKGAFLNHVKIFASKDARIELGPRLQAHHCIIQARAGGRIHVDGRQTCILNTKLIVREPGGLIRIGEDFSMQGGIIQSVESQPVLIGSHCMFSGDLEIISGDLHPIFNLSNKVIINPSCEIVIGDHVWIAAHVRVLKGVTIASNVVVGSCALVSNDLTHPNAIYVGQPARLLKVGIGWQRNHLGLNRG